MREGQDLNELARKAKEQLQRQTEQNNEVIEDIYAELRTENSVDSDNGTQANNTNNYNTQLNNRPTEYQENPTLLRNHPDGYIEDREPILPYDEPLFQDGPTKSQVESWKKQWVGYEIYVTEIVGQYFVFRTLNRFEYKQLVAMQNIDPLQREEIIAETVTLWPSNYRWDKMALDKAGIPSTYAQIIMEKSGFVKDYAIQVI